MEKRIAALCHTVEYEPFIGVSLPHAINCRAFGSANLLNESSKG